MNTLTTIIISLVSFTCGASTIYWLFVRPAIKEACRKHRAAQDQYNRL